MKPRASSLLIGSLTLALIAGGFGAFLGVRKYTGVQGRVPLRVVFEGSASGLHKGGGVNLNGVRVGEVVSLTLDNPRRVVALAMIDNTAPVRKDTEAGLEFQGLTGVAAISLIGGAIDGPPVPLDTDGVPVLTADPDALLDVQEKIRVALRNIDRVIKENRGRGEGYAAQLRDVHGVAGGQRQTDHRRRRCRRRRHERHRRQPWPDPEVSGEPRQRQIWRRPAADRDLASRIDREFRQALRHPDGGHPPHARRTSASPSTRQTRSSAAAHPRGGKSGEARSGA